MFVYKYKPIQHFISAASDSSVNTPKRFMNNVPEQSVYEQGQTPNMLGEAYRPIGKTDFEFKDFLNDSNKVEEVKCFNM